MEISPGVCRPCALVLEQLCRDTSDEELCRLAEDYAAGRVGDDRLDEATRKVLQKVTPEALKRAKCALVRSGRLTWQEAGIPESACLT